VFPTLLEPLPTREQLRDRVGDDEAWEALFERPLGEAIEEAFDDDVVRGVALTDALIGTFASAHDESLRQNRCFLYHVIGNGTGQWDVPIGGMGALTDELARCAAAAGAELVTGAEVSAIDSDGRHAEVRIDRRAVSCEHVVAACAPEVLDRLLGVLPAGERPEGAQLKVNMLLARLPRLRDGSVAPEEAFTGTFHVNETYGQLEAAYEDALDGRIPLPLPCEIYSHSLTDPSILGPGVIAHTLTLFSLHTPARLFEQGVERGEVLDAALRSLDAVLAEPVEDCLLLGPDGEPCLEAKTPLDLEDELALPRGNIFHRDLAWPFAEDEWEAGRWGTETAIANVHLGGAGARRGGGVSGIPGRNAAMSILG
jgi:phytoene dehydrogenase-like protein